MQLVSMEVKKRILGKATEMFFKFGIRSITMDDVAKELGMSKKTIYQHFEDKDALVVAVLMQHMEDDKCEWDELSKMESNPIKKLILGIETFKNQFTDLNASMVFDIKKYHPKAWDVIETNKTDYLIPQVEIELKDGVDKGLFRKDINIPFMARYRFGQVLMGFDQSLFPTEQFGIVDVQTTLIDHFIRGIVTEKGYQLYKTINF